VHPKTAFTSEEDRVVSDYLTGGGAAFIAVDVAEKRRELGLENALQGFGLYPRLNYLVLAPRVTAITEDQGQVFGLGAQLQILGSLYSEHPIVRSLRDSTYGTHFPHSTFVEIEDEPIDDLTVEAIIWAPMVPGRPDGLPIGMVQEPGRTTFSSPLKGKDKTGSRLAIAAAAQRAVATRPSEPVKSARVVYFCDSDFLTDQVTSQIAPNIDLAVAAVQWCIKREKLIGVSERTIDQQRVDVTPKDIKLARLWPLGVAFLSLIMGGLVWWTRRR